MLKNLPNKLTLLIFFIKLVKTKQHSQATTVENLKSETGWEFHVLVIKKTEYVMYGESTRRKSPRFSH